MEEKNIVYCERCGGQIKNRTDLIVVNDLFEVVPYHSKCFAKEVKGIKTLTVGNEPINGVMFTIGSFISIIAFLVLLIKMEFSIALFIFLVAPSMRLYSWLAFERYL